MGIDGNTSTHNCADMTTYDKIQKVTDEKVITEILNKVEDFISVMPKDE